MATAAPQTEALKSAVEDDDFIEFEVEDWREEDEDPKKAALWDQGWDDDSTSDAFCQQLRAQLAARPADAAGNGFKTEAAGK